MSGPPTTTPPAQGFVFPDVPRTAAEALSRAAFADPIGTAKAAIMRHVLDHFEGEYSAAFRAVVKTADSFILDLNAIDRMKVPVQLAKRYPNLAGRLPAIVINCNRFRGLATSIQGGVEGGFQSPDRREIYRRLSAKWDIGLELMVMAQDPGQADQLMVSIALIYTVMRVLTTSAELNGDARQDGWILNLPPVEQIAIDGPHSADMHGDPIDELFWWTIALPCTFEATALVRWARRTKELVLPGPAPAITASVPATIPLSAGSQYSGIANRPLGSRLQSSDERVATVDRNGFIHPRQIGTFEIQVRGRGAGAAGELPVILFSKQIRVV